MRAQQSSDYPLAAPMWLRARDLKSWLPIYRHNDSKLSSEQLFVGGSSLRKLAERHIAGMPLHSLLPADECVARDANDALPCADDMRSLRQL